jgi:hypothetical protein
VVQTAKKQPAVPAAAKPASPTTTAPVPSAPPAHSGAVPPTNACSSAAKTQSTLSKQGLVSAPADSVS